jgi:hypothetical protein
VATHLLNSFKMSDIFSMSVAIFILCRGRAQRWSIFLRDTPVPYNYCATKSPSLLGTRGYRVAYLSLTIRFTLIAALPQLPGGT